MNQLGELKDQILNNAFELGKKYESECTGCAQCAIAAILEALGIWNDDIFKAGSGLADGLGLTGDGTCGALTGASIVISYLFGREHKDFKDIFKPFKSYELVKKLHSQYIQQYGSCRCHDVQKSLMGRTWNFWDPDDIAEAFAPGGILEHCPNLVGNIARLATKIILDEGFDLKKEN